MIDYNGDFKDLPFSNASMYSLVDYANDKKNEILKSFFRKLDLNPSLFDHLYDIDILIDNTNEDNNVYAYYAVNNPNTGEPAIYMTTNFLIKQLTNIDKDPLNKEKYINQVIITLIHETIHSNRSILVKNSINVKDTAKPSYNDNEYFKKVYADFEDLLSKKYCDEDITLLKIVASFTDYEIIVYNRKLDSYEYYYIDYDYIDNDSPTLFEDIKEIIEYNLNDLTPCISIKRIDKDAVADLLASMDTNSEYQLPLSSNEQLVEGEKISSQLGLEEALTECLAYIIFESSNHSTFDKDEICTKLENDFKTYDIKIANEIFKQMDESFIKWFILSCYEDEYTDRIGDYYGEYYPKLVRMFDSIYSSYLNLKAPDSQLYFDTLQLIKKNNR